MMLWAVWKQSGEIILKNADSRVRVDCSYGLNIWAQSIPGPEPDARYWQTVPGKSAANIPLLTDSVLWWACRSSVGNPPEYEDTWTDSPLPCCMNRHHGFVSGIFMDWSSRPVGVKELWTLKWHREYKIQGPWTKASGIQPEDWPQWMRNFKDYQYKTTKHNSLPTVVPYRGDGN